VAGGTTVDGGTAQGILAQAGDRARAGVRLFAAEGERVAAVCHTMANRFAAGGRLLALGGSPAARSDAHHVAVEFVHPVIVGKRALPALAVTATSGERGLVRRLEQLLRRDDIVIAFGAESDDGECACAVELARRRGALTIGFGGSGGEFEFEPGVPDRYVRQELVETLYHVLWELVHVFFEHRGLLAGRTSRPLHDAGASSFLYPFLAEREDNLERVLDDVRRSAVLKAQEVGELRVQTLGENSQTLRHAAAALRARLHQGGALLALGNGGSATDAMDVVADLGAAGVRAIDLTEDPAILTAIANDIGTEAIFARQVIAYGGPGDALLALSTSGNSANVIAALEEGRRRGLHTIAMVGYDGGRIAAEGLADHVVVTRSEHIPRIQEAQASAYHVLIDLVCR